MPQPFAAETSALLDHLKRTELFGRLPDNTKVDMDQLCGPAADAYRDPYAQPPAANNDHFRPFVDDSTAATAERNDYGYSSGGRAGLETTSQQQQQL